jgi:hypothetical protein
MLAGVLRIRVLNFHTCRNRQQRKNENRRELILEPVQAGGRQRKENTRTNVEGEASFGQNKNENGAPSVSSIPVFNHMIPF